jgi:hypothetical protein
MICTTPTALAQFKKSGTHQLSSLSSSPWFGRWGGGEKFYPPSFPFHSSVISIIFQFVTGLGGGGGEGRLRRAGEEHLLQLSLNSKIHCFPFVHRLSWGCSFILISFSRSFYFYGISEKLNLRKKSLLLKCFEILYQ